MIPAVFQFTQSNLQDFVDCHRRFQLRYIQQLAWPAIETEPVQEHESELQRGKQFHHMIHQHLLGVPEERLTAMVQDEDLLHWWQSYLVHTKDLTGCGVSLTKNASGSSTRCYPEATLSASLSDYRLLAKYDLLIIHPDGQARILDWKTSKQPTSSKRRRLLEMRLQTRLYPYLLSRAGTQFYQGQSIPPDQIEMTYWFVNFPEHGEHFPYNATHLSEDEHYLAGLIEQIKHLSGEFPKTSDERRCCFCVYRSLCERGIQAGLLEAGQEVDSDDETGFNLGFEDIDAIAF
jgi:CRISPR/Cas system-associated exonuclease Cas4 (RecB family)